MAQDTGNKILYANEVREMPDMTDITGTVLHPGNWGVNCMGNGTVYNEQGELIECCCDECDYLRCCSLPMEEVPCQDCAALCCPENPNYIK